MAVGAAIAGESGLGPGELVGLPIMGVWWVCSVACLIAFVCSGVGSGGGHGILQQVVGLVLAHSVREVARFWALCQNGA